MYSVTAPEATSLKSKCGPSCPFRSLRGRICPRPQSSLLVAVSSSPHSLAGTHITPMSAWVFTWPSSLRRHVALCLLLFCLFQRHLSWGVGPPLLPDDHISRSLIEVHPQRPLFQRRSCSHVPSEGILGPTIRPTTVVAGPGLEPSPRVLRAFTWPSPPWSPSHPKTLPRTQ